MRFAGRKCFPQNAAHGKFHAPRAELVWRSAPQPYLFCKRIWDTSSNPERISCGPVIASFPRKRESRLFGLLVAHSPLKQLVESKEASMTSFHWIAIFGAAFVAGMINSVAGGGTLLTFPSLVWLGQSPIVANATSTAALWPGSLGGMWGYRRELRQTRTQLYFLIIPSIVGGIAGAVLLRQTPPGVFTRLVPFLILFATLLFMLQATVQRWLRVHQHHHDGARRMAGAAVFQFGVAEYGGYFGR